MYVCKVMMPTLQIVMIEQTFC